MRFTIIAFLITSLVVSSCNTKVKTASERNQPYAYFNENIGWKLTVPVGYEIVEGDQLYENNREGIEQTEQTSGQKMDTSLLVNAFSFQKDSSTIFQSIVLPNAYDSLHGWLQNNQGVKSLFYSMYSDQGVTVDSTETIITSISGKDFYEYELKLKNEKGEVKMQQTFFNAFFGDHELNVTIVADNDESKNELIEIFKKSVFK